MIKIWLKHWIFEKCIDCIFDNISSNFNTSLLNLNNVKKGELILNFTLDWMAGTGLPKTLPAGYQDAFRSAADILGAQLMSIDPPSEAMNLSCCVHVVPVRVNT